MLHYVPRWLPLSERFVFDVVARSRYRSTVVSALWPQNRDVFPHESVHCYRPLLAPVPPPLRQRVRTAILSAHANRHGTRLVHTHFGFRIHDAAGLVRRRRLPWVVSLHGLDVTGMADRHRYYADAFGDADVVVVPSRFLADRAVEVGAPRELIRVMPSGVDLAKFQPSPLPDEPLVLFAGRFRPKKGIDVLATAWPQVRSTIPSARLHVAGYGELEDVARSVADRLTLSPTNVEVAEAMCAARVIVSPSRTGPDGDSESLLLVNLEAQASARALVTTDHGGIPEFVDRDRSALVVPENDPAALAEAIVRVLQDDDLAQRLAAAGPGVAARFTVERSVEQMDSLYDELLAGRR